MLLKITWYIPNFLWVHEKSRALSSNETTAKV
jgi:hypothetical protein